MHRLPLADQLPYRFHPPRLSRFWVWATGPYRRRMLRRTHRVVEVDIAGTEHLAPMLGRGDGVLVAPNHSDNADALTLFELGDRLRRPFCFMAAYQIFAGGAGLRHWLFPRLGAFPVDREGADLKAFKAGVEVLTGGEHPLVIFPEGEVYHMADRLTPLREGAIAVAVTAAKRLADAGRTVWIVPAALKYRFLDAHDPRPALEALMGELEARFTWWPRTHRPLVDRIYDYAEAVLALKELEYLGAVRAGPLPERLSNLRAHILHRIEDHRLGRRRSDPVPVRVKELRRACLDALADPLTTPEAAHTLRRDLNDLFVAVQLFSYPGDYVRACPTQERVAESLMKLEEDVLGVGEPTPRGPRRAILRLGPPIDVRERLAALGKPRVAIPALTAELEARMQGLLDQIGPGRRLEDRTAEDAERKSEDWKK
jgi:1-acyl-sn-glycerol-3-phosphate acyltransferase